MLDNYNPLSELTKKIVNVRHSQKDSFIIKRNRLEELQTVLQRIICMNDSNVWLTVIGENSNRTKLWDEIKKKAHTLLDVVTIALTEGSFSSAYSRATRSYVNIGAVGIKREGKSSFISQATSLNSWLIPTRDGDDPCTTAAINIINGALKDEHGNPVKDVARIHYFAVPEMVEYINLYIEELHGRPEYKLSDEVRTRKEFERKCKKLLSDIEKDGNFGDGDIENRKTFTKYLKNVSSYATRLLEYVYDSNGQIKRDEAGNPITTSRKYKDFQISEIIKGDQVGREYYSSVSYYDSPGDTVEKFTSFATKLAEVATSFEIGNAPVENIQFLDTPGIGESKAGIEKTLSDAITMKLDAVIIVKAVGNSKSDADKNSFYNILRNKLNSKGTANKWLYYVLNIWKDKVHQGDIRKAQQDVIDSLSIAQKSASINLDDNHFRYMNLKDGCELDENGKDVSYDNPVNSYLEFILSNLVPNILTIDSEFFKDGLKEYNEIEAEWNSLHPLLERLASELPNTDTSFIVEELIVSLGKKLTSIATWNGFLEETIKPNLSLFQNSQAGIYTLEVLQIPTSEDNLNNPDLSMMRKFCAKNKSTLNQYSFRESHYNLNKSFTDYTSRKLSLQEKLIDAVEQLIAEGDAKDRLDSYKSILAEAFKKEGRFDFIPTTTETWWCDVAQFLKKEQVCPHLAMRFQKIANLSIRVKEALSGTITATIQASLRNDDFGGADGFTFGEYQEALCSFVHSLILLEGFAKALIEVEVFDKELKNVQNNITTELDRISEICDTNDNLENAKTRNELRAFYQLHLDEVLKDDPKASINAIVSKWREIVKIVS